MLSAKDTMLLTKKLMADGIQDTYAWFTCHTEEQCLDYLYASQSDIVKINSAGYTDTPSIDIVHYCSEHSTSYLHFNNPVIISAYLTSCKAAFRNCREFNQEVIVPEGVTICSQMLTHCKAFNSKLILPSTLKDCSYMLQLCDSFNQPLTVPEGVEDCSWMLDQCTSFNQPLVIPKSVTKAAGLLYGCSNYTSHIKVPEHLRGIASIPPSADIEWY